MVDAIALLRAAIKNVVLVLGSSRLDCWRSIRLKVSCKKNVMLGFRVRISEAEYPDQNPRMPFSERIEDAISATVGSVAFDPDRAEIIDAVCFRVTMFAMGVVKNFEHAPAIEPKASSSKTGKVVVSLPCLLSRLVRR